MRADETVPASFDPTLITAERQDTVVVRGVVSMAEIRQFFDRSFSLLMDAMSEQQLTPIGAAFALYHREPTDTADLEVGFPVSGPARNTGGVESGSLPGGTVARATHVGSFDALGESWQSLAEWIKKQGLEPDSQMWEVYLTEPRPDMDPRELRTELNWPAS